jgi:alpha-2-macroglobulin
VLGSASKMIRSFWFALISSIVATAAVAEERAVQLLLPSRQLEPTSTFELRFANEMVAADQMGKPATPSPLVFAPALEGQFVWLSTRSGTFAAKGLLPLGTKFQISLRPGLKDVAGRAVTATLRETLETPPMRVKGVSTLSNEQVDNAPALPRYLVLFNANVNAAACAKFFRFTNAAGAKIEARVGQAGDAANRVRSFEPYQSDDRSLSLWGEPPAAPSETNESGEETDEKNKPTERKNILVVTPANPLSAGTDWKLIIEHGLPASEWKVALPARKEIIVGSVKPFAVSNIAAESNRIAGRRVIVDFSKTLAEEVTPETVSRWISIAPGPENLKAEIEDKTVTFKGKFGLGVRYNVALKAGLPAREPFKLERPQTREVAFKEIAPRLYFEDFATHQHLAGTRRFRLLSVNVPRIRVTARLFTGDTTPVAVKAYDHYEEQSGDLAPDEMYNRIDVEKLPGKVIWERELNPAAGVDQPQTLPLNWDEILGEHRTGAVLLTAESVDPVTTEHKRVGTQAVVQLTDLGAVWKRDRSRLSVHIFSLTKGQGIAGVKLRLLDAETKQVEEGEATTDKDGNASLPAEDEARWVFAEREGDGNLIAIHNGDTAVPLYRLGVAESGEDEVEVKSVFLFTERGVYKPGDVVHLKGFARSLDSGSSSVPTGKTLKVTATDAKDREFFTKQITLSDVGSFAEEIKLPAETLGRYRVAVAGEEGDGLTGNCDFQVQQYRPNAFEISIPPPPAGTGPAQLDLAIPAKYLMGKPLVKAKLTWSLVARDVAFKPDGLDDFVFCNGTEDFRLNRALDRISQFNAQGEADLDTNGVAKVAASVPINSKAPQPRAAKLLCEVTDLSQQTVSESRAFVQQSSDFYFGLRRFDAVFKEGAPLPIDLIAVGLDGKALAAPVKSTLRLTRFTWQTNRLAAAGDIAEFDSKVQLEAVWERELSTTPGSGTDRKPIAATLPNVVAGKPGEYLLEASGKDAEGHDVLTSATFAVAGPGETVWNYRNPYAIDLVTDKENYEPGQTAAILVKTPIAGEALVTVERDRVLRSFITRLSGNSPSIQVPVAETDAPNVFVSVMLLRGANDSPRKIKTPEYRIGYCELRVARPGDKLTVQVRPLSAASKPGDKVEIQVDVRDAQGKPATDSETVLYAVDEGVLSLTDYKTPDPLAFFNQRRALAVQTNLTLPTLLTEDAQESDFANKGYLIGDGKGGPPLLNGLRKNFLACAFWNATLRTNAQGQVRAEFVAPDSLTRYRVIAIAATKQNQFGGGESAFEINKPVMLEASLPHFANLGDKFVLRGVLHNTTDLAGEADVELQLDATAKAGEGKRHVALPAHASLPIDFSTEIVATGTAQWRWSVHFVSADKKTEFHDALQSEVNVGYPAPLLREVETKRIENNDAELKRVSDPQILEGTGQATVDVANTRVIELRESLRYLLHYPYGCVEQTTSSLLPWLMVRDLRATLPELAKTDAEIAKAVDHGVNLLMSMQTSDGGLSFWPGGREATLWGSAYGGLALAVAEKQKFSVPEAEAKKLFGYLSGQLRGMAKDATGYGLSAQCLAAYTLAVAGKAEPAYHDLLFQKRAKLSAEDRALVALAVIESKGPKATIDELLRTPTSSDAYIDQFFGSIARENALHLLAWTLHEPRSPRVDELAVELFRRRSNGHWSTTQADAWSLLSLSAYLRQVETGDKNATGQILWDKATAPFSVSKERPIATATFPIVNKTAAEPIRVSKSGGQIFSEVTVEATPKLIERPRQDRGYAITRRYSKLGDDGRLSAAENLRVGDRVLVTLDVDVRRRATYLAVEDPLPAVLEAINPAFKSQEVLGGETLGTEWVSDYHELREDRAVFFSDLLYPGRYTLRYLARVISAGDAIAASAKIEEMYHPERFGTTETAHVRAESLQ